MNPSPRDSVASTQRSGHQTYRFGSRLVTSDLPLAALPLAPAMDEASEIVIERVHGAIAPNNPPIHEWHENDELVLSLSRCDEHFCLHFPDLADFELQFSRRRIRVFADLVADASTLEHLLVDQVLPRYVAHLDSLVAHASAVDIGGRNVLFLGQSGWGKSTLAGLMNESGHRVLSDDCVQLIDQEGLVMALATYPSLRLLPDSLKAIFPGLDSASPVADYTDKLRVPVAASDGDHVAVAVDAIYVLGDPAKSAGSPIAYKLAPATACLALIEHSFRLDLSDRNASAAHFKRCSTIARSIPAFNLQYPRNYADGQALVHYLTQHLASLPSGRRGS